MKKKVVSIVLNSVSHDSRVKKQAESLSKAGYDVTIIGIRDNRVNIPENFLEYGTRIIRVPWRSKKELFILKVWGIFILIFFMLFLINSFTSQNFGIEYIIKIILLYINQLFTQIKTFFLEKRPAIFSFLYKNLDNVLILTLLLLSLRFAMLHFKYFYRYKAIEESNLNYFFKKRRKGLRIRVTFRIFRAYFIYKYLQRAVFPQLLKLSPDIIHCHDLPSLPIGIKYKRDHNCTLIYDSHEIFEELSSMIYLSKKYYMGLQQLYSSKVDYFITVNDSIGEYFNKKYSSLPKAVIVRNAVMVANKRKSFYDGRLHNAAGILQDKKILLYHGGFSVSRGLLKLVFAATRLPDDWVLVLMGWGSLKKHYLIQLRLLIRKKKKLKYYYLFLKQNYRTG